VTVQARTTSGARETAGGYLVGCDGGASTVRRRPASGSKAGAHPRAGAGDLRSTSSTGDRHRPGRHYNFIDANASTLIAQGCRTEFTLHTSLPADTDFRPVIEDLIGFAASSRSRTSCPGTTTAARERYRDGASPGRDAGIW